MCRGQKHGYTVGGVVLPEVLRRGSMGVFLLDKFVRGRFLNHGTETKHDSVTVVVCGRSKCCSDVHMFLKGNCDGWWWSLVLCGSTWKKIMQKLFLIAGKKLVFAIVYNITSALVFS